MKQEIVYIKGIGYDKNTFHETPVYIHEPFYFDLTPEEFAVLNQMNDSEVRVILGDALLKHLQNHSEKENSQCLSK